MCFGGGPKVDDSIQRQQMAEAEAARKKEEEREARIKTGTAKLDTQFAGFDDNFYNGRRNAYTGFYQPQLDDQFGQARDQLTYALARAGTLNSTLAADKQADLTKKYDVQRASILSQANDQVSAQQSRIGNEKSALVAQLNATGDADAVSNQALSRTQQLYQEQPAYNPLGDIFSGVAAGIGNYVNNQNNTNAYNSYFGGKANATPKTVY